MTTGNSVEVRLATLARLEEVLALPVDAVGIGQDGCFAKLPGTDELRRAAARVRAAGPAAVVVAPIAWPRTATALHERLLAVAADGPTTVVANDLGTALALAAAPPPGTTLVAGLGLTRSRPHSADQDDSAPPRAGLDTALLAVLAAHGVRAAEVDTDTDLGTANPCEVRQFVDAVPVGYGRACPTARHHGTGPPDCLSLCDQPFRLTANGRWQLNHGHREPLPAGTGTAELTVWGNVVYQPATAEPTGAYRIVDARWHPGSALAETVHKHRTSILIGH